MDKEDNESLNDTDLSSIRRKYKGGRLARSKINYAVVLNHAKHEHNPQNEVKDKIDEEKEEEKIIIKKETKLVQEISLEKEASPQKVEKIETKNENTGKLRDKYVFVKNDKQKNSKSRYGNELSISKTNEIKSELDSRFNNNKRKGNQNKNIKEEITTKTITTTENISGLSPEKKEIIMEVTNKNKNKINENNISKTIEEDINIVTSKAKTITTEQTFSRQSPDKKEIKKTVINKIDENNTPKKFEGTTKKTAILNQTSTYQPKSAQKVQSTETKITTTNTMMNKDDNNRGRSQGQHNEINKQININQKDNIKSKSLGQKAEKAKDIKIIQRQSSRDQNKGQKSVSETINIVTTFQGQNSRTQSKEQKILTQTTRQISSNQAQNNNRTQSTNKKTEIVKQTNNMQRQDSRNSKNSRNQKSAQKIKEVQTIQRNTSRKSSQEENKRSQIVKEVTTTTAVNKRNSGNKNVTSTTKTITSINHVSQRNSNSNERNSRTRDLNTSSKLNLNKADRSKNIQSVVTDTADNQKYLVNQKSNSMIKNYNTEKTAKKPLSSMTEINSSRHNLKRITINESSKKKDQPYVLHVRKLDRIQQKERGRIFYTNNMNERNPIKSNFNHKIIVVKNVTKEFKTWVDVPQGEKGAPKEYIVNRSRDNLSRRDINVSKNKEKPQVVLSPRKNIVIKSTKKPYKLTYENYVENDNDKEIIINLKSKLNDSTRNSRNSNSRKFNDVNNSNKITSIRTVQTNVNFGRNQPQININKDAERSSKISITKTVVNNEYNNGKFGQYQSRVNVRAITENSQEIKKVETIKTTEVSSKIRGSRNKNENNEEGRNKIITVKKTEISYGSGDNSRFNNKNNQESTVTTTKIMTNTSQNAGEGGSIFRKFKSVRNFKK